jgi:FkbM family methyltransferase
VVFFGVVYNYVQAVAYLLRTPRRPSYKLRAAVAYTRLTLLLPVGWALRRRHARVMGMRVEAASFWNIHYLFGEIFMRGAYYFVADRHDPVVLDLGANAGFAVLYVKQLYPRAVVHAFEPDPATVAMLRRNVARNGLRDVHVYAAAAGAADGTAQFYVDERPGELTMGLVRERLGRVGTVHTVPVVGLAGFLAGKQVDLLKMDIEGYETEVFASLDHPGSLDGVRELVVEYHHLIPHRPAALGWFLSVLERQGLSYKLDAASVPIASKGQFQDVLVYAYRDGREPAATPGGDGAAAGSLDTGVS